MLSVMSYDGIRRIRGRSYSSGAQTCVFILYDNSRIEYIRRNRALEYVCDALHCRPVCNSVIPTYSNGGSGRTRVRLGMGELEMTRFRPDAVKQLRVARELRQSNLAAAAGTTAATVSRVERGLHSPSAQLIAQIADALDQPVARFFVSD